MIVADPQVTLHEDGHGFPDEARDTAMIGWNLVTSLHGDDGERYWLNIGAMSLGSGWADLDFWQMCVRSGKGRVVQPAGSVHKVVDFPEGRATEWHMFPRGALTTTKSEETVVVALDGVTITCRPDGTWHYLVEDQDAGISGEWTHTGNGYPMWYGKGSPQAFTPHSISYGYIWSGAVRGHLTLDGRRIAVRGAGQRERYYAVDACPAEVGAWHDWMWFHFDEMSGSLDEMKGSQHKDVAVYLNREQQYIPAGDFQIEHSEWAFDPTSGVFLPTRYDVTIELSVGVVRFSANAVSSYAASGVGAAPDSPTILLDWDTVEGTFTHESGQVTTLTNGLGGTLIRQWKPYPSAQVGGGDFETLSVPRV